MKTENREYWSDVFSMLMEVPEYALDVYNALNGTDYSDPDLIEIKTLEKGISLSIRNDAVSNAIEYCIKNNILRDFFESRKDEVRKNMTLDMTFEAREKMIRRDEFTAGRAEGKAEGIEKIFLNMVSHGFDMTDAIEITCISKEKAEELVTAK